MSADGFREAGFKAIEQRKWPEAIENLSKAIERSKSPAWLLARSQAFMETGQLEKAIRDADYAYCTAAERGNDKSRKQMIEAQYRRSVCYFRKKEYANADICAVWSQRLAKGVSVREAKNVEQEGVNDRGFYFATVEQAMAEGNKSKDTSDRKDQMATLSALMSGGGSESTPYSKDWNKAQVWRGQVLRFLEPLPEDDPARKITITLTPTKPSLEAKDDVESKNSDGEIESTKASAVQAKSKPNEPNFRIQFYQTDTTVTISVFMKFASKADMDKIHVKIDDNSVFMKHVPREPDTLYIKPYDLVDHEKSNFRVAPMKVELTLVKLVPGKWPDFGTQSVEFPESLTLKDSKDSYAASSNDKEASPQGRMTPDPESKISASATGGIENSKGHSEAPARKTETKAAEKAPAYPTSSKSGPKDWDSIAKDGDDEEPTDVDFFFKQLYKNSTPEQQRAMMKSYTESKGTALSTDWSSVSQGPVEPAPPDGIVAKNSGS